MARLELVDLGLDLVRVSLDLCLLCGVSHILDLLELELDGLVRVGARVRIRVRVRARIRVRVRVRVMVWVGVGVGVRPGGRAAPGALRVAAPAA